MCYQANESLFTDTALAFALALINQAWYLRESQQIDGTELLQSVAQTGKGKHSLHLWALKQQANAVSNGVSIRKSLSLNGGVHRSEPRNRDRRRPLKKKAFDRAEADYLVTCSTHIKSITSLKLHQDPQQRAQTAGGSGTRIKAHESYGAWSSSSAAQLIQTRSAM
jgi:hypothetical protein